MSTLTSLEYLPSKEYVRFTFGTTRCSQFQHLRHIRIDEKECVLFHSRLSHKNQIDFRDWIKSSFDASTFAAAQSGARLVFKYISVIL